MRLNDPVLDLVNLGRETLFVYYIVLYWSGISLK